jgi:G:T/U-mismatch repair DNA glycosylase
VKTKKPKKINIGDKTIRLIKAIIISIILSIKFGFYSFFFKKLWANNFLKTFQLNALFIQFIIE